MKILNVSNLSFRKKIFLFAFPVFLVIMLSSSNAQLNKKNNFADSLSTVLQKKLLLSDAQKSEVQSIIINYLQNPIDESTAGEANYKILEVLNKRQKAKYEIIKNEWWKKINNKKLSEPKK